VDVRVFGTTNGLYQVEFTKIYSTADCFSTPFNSR